MKFDHPDRLNEDGSVTITLCPSIWHVYNIAPDTYSLFTMDHEDGSTLEWYCVESGADIEWDDLDWDYDHSGIVKDLAETLMNWITERLMGLGLESITNVNLKDTWSPREYNFTSDGFEMEFTCDPEELRSITPEGFDVDEWAAGHYSSRSGFISYITGRMENDEWHALYDGEFRVEAILAADDPENERPWIWAADEDLSEIHMNRVTTSPAPEVFAEDSSHLTRVDDAGDAVRYHTGKGWSCDEEDFYEDLLTYHREACKLVSVVKP